MIIYVLVSLCVAAQSRAPPGDCFVSDWRNWGEWRTAVHDGSAKSFPAPKSSPAMWDKIEKNMNYKEQFAAGILQCVADGTCPIYDERPTEGRVNCVNNMANDLECWNVDQLSFVSIADYMFNPDVTPTPKANDMWGWTDPENGDEYAIAGLRSGTTFLRVTDPENPEVVGHLQTHGTEEKIWRDAKVIGNYVFIVSELADHGVQVFDLTRLRDAHGVIFTEDAHYSEVGNCHNIAANTETGFVYPVGCTKGDYPNICAGGIHAVDVSDPLNPTFAGCFGDDEYTHDTQCVVYRGPHVAYQGRELCFAYNLEHLTIVDVTEKSDMYMVSRTGYEGAMYVHQGWLTEDQTVLLLDDELDEKDTDDKIQKTYIWDVTNLDAPILMNTYRAAFEAVDHNQFINGSYVYQSNYQAGLRILYIDQENFMLHEVAYIDVLPGETLPDFGGSGSNYPFLGSKNILVACTPYGLFVVRPDYAAMEQVVKDMKTRTERKKYRDILRVSDMKSCPNLVELDLK